MMHRMSVEQLNGYLQSTNPQSPLIVDAKLAWFDDQYGFTGYWVLVPNQSDSITEGFKKKYFMMHEHYNNMVHVLKQGDSVSAIIRYI